MSVPLTEHHILKQPQLRCPGCAAVLDGATTAGAGQRLPEQGDISFCIYCGSVNEYQIAESGKYSLRAMSEEEVGKLSKSSDLLKVLEQFRLELKKKMK